ncbi:MAG: CBS domain-containing protein, partial [Candidatus Thermoplasmatota archaeon]|nr:CBS domain-containing protein [Candidatus Thermoplasmatota archaeon]
IMDEKLNVADPNDRVVHARNTMKREDVARLLIMDKGKLVGIISDNEIAFALASVKRAFPIGKQKHQLDELLIRDVMKTKVVWAKPSITISDAAKIMMKFNVGSLPLIEGGIVKGIVTRTNLLKTVKS